MYNRNMLQVSAPGKVIICGEHAVVYGYPAIATAINLRLTATYSPTEKIFSQIPIGGLGSSSALSVCRAVHRLQLGVRPLSNHSISQKALILDREFHTNPSGLDTSICTYGGWISLQGQSLKLLHMANWPQLYLLNSGRPTESTADMVGFVGNIMANNRKSTEQIFNKIASVSESLQGQSMKWGELIRKNEQLLEELGVVSESTKKLIIKLELNGASAKITGAGGIKNGSGMILIYHPDPPKLLAFAGTHHLSLLPVILGCNGVSYSVSI